MFTPFMNLNRPVEVNRREVLAGLLAFGLPRWALAREPADALHAGGGALVLRHAATDPGIGDPPDFNLAVCSTQRNLSPAGRSDAQRIGAWFKQNRLTPIAVRSSAWCRCQDTARLAFGQFQVWSPLNSVFGDRIALPDQTETLRAALKAIKPGQFEVWVTHQVNITSLTQRVPAMGEGFVVDAQGQVLASLNLN
jgi:phosphohistidine phosphatase SixA